MLAEIFNEIGDQIIGFLKENKTGIKRAKYHIGPVTKPGNNSTITFEILRFGFDINNKNYLSNGPAKKSYYSFSFKVGIQDNDYEKKLKLIESVCDHLDKKPFLQIKINEREYEVAISSLELSLQDLNQFWLAQNKPHQPALFYQATISEV